MEIDPLRMNQESDSTINTLELWLVAQKMLKVIVDSERAIPVSVRRILRHVNEEIGARYGDLTQYRAIGGFYFLRLICPALMAPQVYGLLEEPPHPMAQRQLILIAKVIQNLANDTMPGAKEEYMEKLNAFITSNKPTLERFYSRILDNPDNGKDAHPMPVPDHARDSALITIHHFLAQHRETVEQAIREDQEDSSGGGSDDSESLVEELRRALDALGDPSGDEAV
jgi:dsDNA-binding SOS-regulon protein